MTLDELERHLGCPVDEAMALPSESTLERLGIEMSPLGGVLPKPGELIAAARGWLDVRRREICLVCSSNAVVADYIKGGRSYKIAQILAIIADLIQFRFKTPAAGAAWASVALLQLGIEQFCSDVL